MMKINDRKSILAPLTRFDYLCNDKNAFIEITEWTNGEGWDINICENTNNKQFQLTSGELAGINYLANTLEYPEKNES